MGIGGYLSTKAERDNYRYLLRQTQQLVESSCTRALEEEIFKILSPYGLSSTDSKRIVQNLHAADRTAFGTVNGNQGLTNFLLKFGEGVECISIVRLYGSALTIGFSYFLGGLIPMVNILQELANSSRFLTFLSAHPQMPFSCQSGLPPPFFSYSER